MQLCNAMQWRMTATQRIKVSKYQSANQPA